MNEAERLWPAAPHIAVAGALGVYAAAIAIAPGARTALALSAPLVIVPLCWWTVASATRWLVLFCVSALMLPPLPFMLGESGPHVALVFAALGLLAGTVRVSEWHVRMDLLTTALLVYLAVLVASVPVAALSSGIEIAAGTLARVILFGIAVYAFVYTAHGPETDAAADRGIVKVLYWAGILSATFAVIDFYYQLPAPAGFGQQFVWLPSGVFRRAQGVFYDAMALGNVSAFFLTMAGAAILRPKAERLLSRPALAIGGVVFSAALILSFSRSALLNLLVAGLALLILHRSRIRLRRVAAVALIATAAAAAVGFILPSFAELYWGRLRGTLEFVFSAPESVLSGRVDTWRTLGHFLLDHPAAAVVGVGYKTLPYSGVSGQPLVVDNMYLSTLAETGIIGLLALLLLSFAILRAALRAARHQDPVAAFAGVCIFSFWMGQMVQMFSVDVLTYWRVLPVYMWVLAVAVRRARSS